MWEGISLKDFQNNIYRNFYSESDIELINGAEDADLASIKRLINKARKIGDLDTAFSLEDMYVELLRIPEKHHAPLLPTLRSKPHIRERCVRAWNLLEKRSKLQ